MLREKLLSIDFSAVERKISEFLSNYLRSSKANCYVLGLSGGVDSSTVAALAAKSVSPERVIALVMPDATATPEDDLRDAYWLADKLDIKRVTAPIDEVLTAASSKLPFFDPKDLPALGNLKARIRMMMLYYVANRLNGLVLGSSDRSELLLGYFTKYGDGAADLLPIGDLYKTQVRMLAIHLGLPEKIAFKPSSPRLWPNQMAEGELGFTYEAADLVLYMVLDLGYTFSRVVEETGIEENVVKSIISRVESTVHKRRTPPVVDLKGIAHP